MYLFFYFFISGNNVSMFFVIWFGETSSINLKRDIWDLYEIYIDIDRDIYENIPLNRVWKTKCFCYLLNKKCLLYL